MVIVSESDETEWLQAGAPDFPSRPKHLGHAQDLTGTSVKGDFDKVSGNQLTVELKDAAGHGDGLQSCARLLASFDTDGGRDGAIQKKSGCTPVGVGLGEVGHRQQNYATSANGQADYQSACPWAYAKNESES